MQNNEGVDHQDVKMYCATTQFTELLFFGMQKIPHGVRGLSKYYQMFFDPKLGHGHKQYVELLARV